MVEVQIPRAGRDLLQRQEKRKYKVKRQTGWQTGLIRNRTICQVCMHQRGTAWTGMNNGRGRVACRSLGGHLLLVLAVGSRDTSLGYIPYPPPCQAADSLAGAFFGGRPGRDRHSLGAI